MRKRRRPTNWVSVFLLIILIFAGVYLNRMVIPNVQLPGVPTATPTRDPESFAAEAEDYFNNGRFQQAIEAYTQAIRSSPNNPGHYVALARTQIYAGLYADALDSAEKALLLNPNNSMANALRAWALNYQGEYVTAESAARKAIELDQNNATAHAILAIVLADEYINDLGAPDVVDRAAEESRVAGSLDPNRLEVRQARGYVLYVTSNYAEAAAEYEAAIGINGNIPELHLQLGINYRALEAYGKAVDEFIQANVLNPSDPTPDLYISRTLGTIGEFAKAEQYAKTAVTDAPTDPYLRGNWGVWLYRNLQWPEAVVQLRLATRGGTDENGVKVEPLKLVNDLRIVEYYYIYAFSLAYTNQCSEVLDIAQQIVNTVPSDENAVYNAQESLRICQANASITPTPVLDIPATPTPTP